MTFSAKLAILKERRNRQIKLVKQRHDVWAHLRATSKDMKERNAAWNAWQQSIKSLHKLNAQIKPLEPGASSASLALAKAAAVWEGGRSADGLFHPYWDSVGGVWTIGYGHTNADNSLHVDANTHPLTVAEATALLLHDLNTQYAPAVDHYLNHVYKWPLREVRFDSLTDFAYNLGPGYFTTDHDIGEQMSRHNLKGVANTMLEYDDPGSAAQVGLLRRRKWEKQLFLGGTYAITN